MKMQGTQYWSERLLASENESQALTAVTSLKNLVVGSNRQKNTAVMMGVLPALVRLADPARQTTNAELVTEAVVVIGSVAKGRPEHVQAVIDSGILSHLVEGVTRPERQHEYKYVIACLRCLRTISMAPQSPSHVVDVIYQDPGVVSHLLSILNTSVDTRECVANILAHCCVTPEHQVVLCSSGAVAVVVDLLKSDVNVVHLAALRCLTALCKENEDVSREIISELAKPAEGKPSKSSAENVGIDLFLSPLLSRAKPFETQLAAAKCVTCLYRAGAVAADSQIVLDWALPSLVRLCKSEDWHRKDWELHVANAAETLAHLIEVEIELQRIASINNHLIATLSEYLKPKVESDDDKKMEVDGDDDAEGPFSEVKQAAFKVFASLSANDEEIRKRIIETDKLMDQVVCGLSDASMKVRLAAVRCLHSLSRSVQQLRTSFQDHTVWKPLMKLLTNAADDVLTVASSTLCNLLLEFSPSKEPIIESGAVELLAKLTRRDDDRVLKLNGIWALMNMSFQAEQNVKTQILNVLGSDRLFSLLTSADVDVLMKSLGLLRNLLTTKPHIDHTMGIHGEQIMLAIRVILDSDFGVEVKEQGLCILANIADGHTAKDFIMTNEEILLKIMNLIKHGCVKLQIAATFCVCNLVWSEEDGAAERQTKLRDMGCQKLLQQLVTAQDTPLFEKVKTALQQFN